jgi:hypothetical protein
VLGSGKIDLQLRYAALYWNTKLRLGKELLKETGSEVYQSRSGNPLS